MKRLYAEATVFEEGESYGIALDGRPVKTPRRHSLLLPNRALAEAVATEWREQGANVQPHTMPIMQLAATVIDGIADNREAVEQAVLRFAQTDAVCYRADAPASLAEQQNAAWQPLIDWVAARTGTRLAVTAGVLPVEQPPETLASLAAIVREMSHWRLGAFQAATASAGSFVIALALMERHIDADTAFAAAELDETFEISHWGDDPEAAERRAGIALDLAAARRFRDLLTD